jgi:hypothetical protein
MRANQPLDAGGVASLGLPDESPFDGFEHAGCPRVSGVAGGFGRGGDPRSSTGTEPA